MRKSLTSVAAVASIALTACFGGGGGGGGGSITSGTYLLSDAAVDDGCGLGVTPGDINGNTLSVVVDTAGGTVTVFGIDMTLSGNSFTYSEQTPQADLFGDGSCLADIDDQINGNITANDQFNLSEDFSLANSTGAGCSGGGITTPCTSSLSFHAVKQ